MWHFRYFFPDLHQHRSFGLMAARVIPAGIAVLAHNPGSGLLEEGTSYVARVPSRMAIGSRCRQEVFDEGRTGFSAERIMERTKLGDRTVGYRIRGKWEVAKALIG
jgi:hypothetical protein